MFWIPGQSYRGPLPPLSEDEKDLSRKLSEHVWMLAGDIGARSLTSKPENLEKAALYLEYVLRGYGYEISREEFCVEVLDQHNRKFWSDGIKFGALQHKTWNVIAEITGKTAASEVVIVGAHYDSVYDCPAANDNGSGVAAMLEIARVLKHEPLDKTLRFVAFTNEEPPFFRTDEMGSYKHAQTCHQQKQNVVAMICLETLGYYSDAPGSQKFPHALFGLMFPNTGNFVSFVSNLRSAPLLRRCVGSFRKAVKFPSEGIAVPPQITGVDFSDQLNFWHLGYPAIMVTDTAFYRYPHYHDEEDTPDKIDYDVFARAGRENRTIEI